MGARSSNLKQRVGQITTSILYHSGAHIIIIHHPADGHTCMSPLHTKQKYRQIIQFARDMYNAIQ